MTDILLSKDKGYYDISFLNGDFKITDGMETALLMSIFCEKRAANSEISTPEMQRGWLGNKISEYENYEIGSKLWLLEQARRDNKTLGLAKTFAHDCLQWLFDDNLAREIKVDAAFILMGIEIIIKIITTSNETINRSYELWSNTNIF